MDPTSVFAEYRDRIVGRSIHSRRLVTNSLVVYIDCEPGEALGLTIWFEPTWHLRNRERVLTGSRQAQHDPGAEEPDAGFRFAAQSVDALVGDRVVRLVRDQITGDLRLDTEGGLTLCTFVSDPSDDHYWHIRDNVSQTVLYAGAGGLEVVEADA